MSENTETKKRNKLASRKFWITIVIIAVAVIEGVRAMGIEDNQIVSVVCMACACIAGIAYVIAEAMVDVSYEVEEAEESADTADDEEDVG